MYVLNPLKKPQNRLFSTKNGFVEAFNRHRTCVLLRFARWIESLVSKGLIEYVLGLRRNMQAFVSARHYVAV